MSRVRQAALEDSAKSVRRAAIEAIAFRGLTDAASRRVLERVAAADRDPELRYLAKRLLVGHG